MQALGYLSLALSLLAGFGAVLGKQWLAQYKTSRFGYGTLEERAIRRHQMLVGIEEWHLHRILDVLPLMLQTSLLLFGISLTISIFTSNDILGSILTAVIAIGVALYGWSFFIAIKYPTSPFQTGLTTTIRHLLLQVSSNWKSALSSSFNKMYQFIFDIPGHMLRIIRRMTPTRLLDIEIGPKDLSVSLTQFYSNLWPDKLVASTLLQRYHGEAVKWTLETSTDPETITQASRMVSETVFLWPADTNLDVVIRQLKYAFDNSIGQEGRHSYRSPSPGHSYVYFEALISLFERACVSNPLIDAQTRELGQWLDDHAADVGKSGPQGAASEQEWIFAGRPRLNEDSYIKPTVSLRPWNTFSGLCEGINVMLVCKRAQSRPLPRQFCADVWCSIAAEDTVHGMVVSNILLGIAQCLGFSGMDPIGRLDSG